MSTIGQRLKEIRKEEKLTQIDFAKRLLISQSYLSSIETGNEIPTDKLLKIACLEFGVNEKWLSDGVGSMYDEVYESDRAASANVSNAALLKIMTLLSTKSNLEYGIYADIINIGAQILHDTQCLTNEERIKFLNRWRTLLMDFERMIFLSYEKNIGSQFQNHKDGIHKDINEIFSMLEIHNDND